MVPVARASPIITDSSNPHWIVSFWLAKVIETKGFFLGRRESNSLPTLLISLGLYIDQSLRYPYKYPQILAADVGADLPCG